jgi:hypothetical protein
VEHFIDVDIQKRDPIKIFQREMNGFGNSGMLHNEDGVRGSVVG